ncbi:MAG TPA: hypothetical protein PK788_07710 [Gemmatimonadaceae bacterium]|nr:hypothetical protein [Gemmatimonadaceae bacterium]HRQ77917.1 hypothetical protein [Gemmatimonadaceae bacterium]
MTYLVAALALSASTARAQTDFYNTDRGRPLTVEDATVVERRAIELQAVPLRVQRAGPGITSWGIAPEIAFGLAPRTQFEIGVPLRFVDAGALGSRTSGAAGVEVELLHQLNAETELLPALALGAGTHLRAGPFAPARTLTTLRAAATRTLPWGRVHLNYNYTPGEALGAADIGADEPRWLGGIALDRTLPLRSTLVGIELTAEESLLDDGEVTWRSSLGMRRQVASRLVVDAGVFRRLSGGAPEWGFTMGGAFAFARPLRRAPRPTGVQVRPTGSQWSTVYKQFFLQAPHNFYFRRNYPAADRMFNAFDYGHAILYELLLTRPEQAVTLLEEREYEKLTGTILNRPPRLPAVEDAIEPMYVRLAPEAKMMFEWAHVLHRQVYDILADDRLDWAAKDREMARLEAYYFSRRDLAFSRHPKTMALMQEQPYSLAFRENFPKFNGLIWAYHWLQVGLYEPLMVGRTVTERQAGVAATVARFRQMTVDGPNNYPHVMPMTAAIAPEFAKRYPTMAIVFDNLHSMHDVISDILANPNVPRAEKRAEILKAASAYRDDTTEVMTVAGWLKMTEMMGLQNQGGPAVGFLPALPTPTVPRGYVMKHDKDGNPIGEHHHHE